jgi:signal transduction histidine kinase
MPARSEPRGRVVVPALAPEAAAAVLAPPRLPPAAVAALPLARRAAAMGVPVLLRVPVDGGRLLIARALHAQAGRPGPLVVASGRRPLLDGLPPGATLLVDAGRLAPETVAALEAVLDDGVAWVLAGIDPGAPLPPSLGGRLAAVAVQVPRLAERPGDMPALVTDALRRLAARAGRAAPRVKDAALAQLAAHAWPGDVAELEATLARALLVAGDADAIGAEHLALGVSAPSGPPAAATSGDGTALEFLIAELAHELRNPMVTIKTYARHLPALVEDEELRARFDALTTDAVDRMDGLLENVLAFARLGTPRRELIEVGPLLGRVLAEVEPELAGRAVRVRQVAAPTARCAADPEQLAYAFRNLLAGVVREVPADEQLALEATANGVVTLRFAGGAEAAERLRRLAAPGAEASLADPSVQPLAFRLARAVLERNGGALAVVPEADEATSLVIRLPAAEVAAA